MDMGDFLIGWAINTVLTFLQIALKNPKKAKQFERAMVKLRNQLMFVYPPEQFPGLKKGRRQ